MDTLKEKLIALIKADSFGQLKLLLKVDFLNNPFVLHEINKIVTILLTDRNQNNKLDIEDLKLIQNDMMAITSLISSIMIILAQVTTLKYQQDATEEIIFKILAYVFLVLVPENSNLKLSTSDKLQIIDVVMSIYQVVKSTQLVQNLIKKIKKWLSEKCCTSNEDKDSKLNEKLVKNKSMLSFAINNIKTQNLVNNL